MRARAVRFGLAGALALSAATVMAQGQTAAPPAATPSAQTPPPAARPAPPTRDPNTPGYVAAKELPDGACRAGRRRRQLHHRADAHAGARDGRAGRRAAGHDPQLHDELGRQQDLSGHRPRRRDVRHARSSRSGEARGDDQPAGAVHAPGRGVRAEAVRARHRRALHRRRRRSRPAAVHGAGQSDRIRSACRR